MTSMLRTANAASQCLFECAVQLRHSDVDWNGHCNQSAYGMFIESALCEWSEPFRTAQCRIGAVTVNYIREMRVDGKDGRLPMCAVKVMARKDDEVVGVHT